MLSSLFKKKPVLDQDATQWLINAYAWAERNIGPNNAAASRVLVLPTNQFFPGRENSAAGMAALILNQVKHHAGVDTWPCRLVDRHTLEESGQLLTNDIHQALSTDGESTPLIIPYEPLQTSNPEALIANYAFTLAYHLAALTKEPPPCDAEQLPHLLELIGVYLGFGVMFANTAKPKAVRSCGSCCSPLMERKGYLSENEVTYALAIFCASNKVEAKEVTSYLKSYQRGFFTKALEDAKARVAQLPLAAPVSHLIGN